MWCCCGFRRHRRRRHPDPRRGRHCRHWLRIAPAPPPPPPPPAPRSQGLSQPPPGAVARSRAVTPRCRTIGSADGLAEAAIAPGSAAVIAINRPARTAAARTLAARALCPYRPVIACRRRARIAVLQMAEARPVKPLSRSSNRRVRPCRPPRRAGLVPSSLMRVSPPSAPSSPLGISIIEHACRAGHRPHRW